MTPWAGEQDDWNPCMRRVEWYQETRGKIHVLYDVIQVRVYHKGRVPTQHAYQDHLETLLKILIPGKTLLSPGRSCERCEVGPGHVFSG